MKGGRCKGEARGALESKGGRGVGAAKPPFVFRTEALGKASGSGAVAWRAREGGARKGQEAAVWPVTAQARGFINAVCVFVEKKG
jgi:hypothetical protein